MRSSSGWSDPGTIISIISAIGAIVVGVLLYRAYRKTNKLSVEQIKLSEAQNKLTEAFHNWMQELKHPEPILVRGIITSSPPSVDPLRVFLTISNPGDAPIFMLAALVLLPCDGG